MIARAYLLIGLLVLTCPGLAASLPTDASYWKAVRAIRQQHLDEAVTHLRTSYRANRHTRTAYLAAYACAQLYDFEATAAWASHALSGEPVLPAIYRQDAAALLGWAIGARPALKVKFGLSKESQSKNLAKSGASDDIEFVEVDLPPLLQDVYRRADLDARLHAAPCAPGWGVEGVNRFLQEMIDGSDDSPCVVVPSVASGLPAPDNRAGTGCHLP